MFGIIKFRNSIQLGFIRGRSYSGLLKNTLGYKAYFFPVQQRFYGTKTKMDRNIQDVEKEIKKVEDEISDVDSQIKAIMKMS